MGVEQWKNEVSTPTSRDTLLAKPADCGSGCEAAIPAPDASQRRVMAATLTLMELLLIRHELSSTFVLRYRRVNGYETTRLRYLSPNGRRKFIRAGSIAIRLSPQAGKSLVIPLQGGGNNVAK